MTKFSGSFSTTDKDKTIRPQKDPVDEVIDILDQIGQDDFTVYTGDTGAQSVTSPQVTVQQTDKIPMSPEQQAQAFTNLYGGNKSLGLYTGDTGFQEDVDFDIYNALSPRPQDNISGFQQASAPSLTAMYYPQERRKGIAGPYEAMDPDMFDPDTGEYINFLDRIEKQRALNSGQGIAGINTQGSYLGDELFNIPTDLGASIDPYEQMGDNLLGGDASTVYGINPIVKRIAEFQGYDMDTDEGVRKYLADTQQTMEDSEDALEARRKDQDRERAAMLAAQQQQPVDPCPEGYRLDPVSKVCVPVDDTTEPDNITPRTYDTMTKPEPNYTAATNFNVPAINLPDIFTGN